MIGNNQKQSLLKHRQHQIYNLAIMIQILIKTISFLNRLQDHNQWEDRVREQIHIKDSLLIYINKRKPIVILQMLNKKVEEVESLRIIFLIFKPVLPIKQNYRKIQTNKQPLIISQKFKWIITMQFYQSQIVKTSQMFQKIINHSKHMKLNLEKNRK